MLTQYSCNVSGKVNLGEPFLEGPSLNIPVTKSGGSEEPLLEDSSPNNWSIKIVESEAPLLKDSSSSILFMRTGEPALPY
jgi:hypothetical protein